MQKEILINLIKFYIKKIWRKNWIRIIIVFLISILASITLPYIAYESERQLNIKKIEDKSMDIISTQVFYNIWKNTTFIDYVSHFYTSEAKGAIPKNHYQKDYEKLQEIYNEIEKKNWENNEGWERNLTIDLIRQIEINKVYLDSVPPIGTFNILDFTLNFTNSIDKIFEKFNNIVIITLFISLSGIIIFPKILKELFYDTVLNNEDVDVLTLTPSVKRFDLFISKIIAFIFYLFLTFICTFIIPHFFCWFYFAENTKLGYFMIVWITTFFLSFIFSLLWLTYSYTYNYAPFIHDIFVYVMGVCGIIYYYIPTPASFLNFTNLKSNLFLRRYIFQPFLFIFYIFFIGIICLFLHYKRFKEQDLN